MNQIKNFIESKNYVGYNVFYGLCAFNVLYLCLSFLLRSYIPFVVLLDFFKATRHIFNSLIQLATPMPDQKLTNFQHFLVLCHRGAP